MEELIQELEKTCCMECAQNLDSFITKTTSVINDRTGISLDTDMVWNYLCEKDLLIPAQSGHEVTKTGSQAGLIRLFIHDHEGNRHPRIVCTPPGQKYLVNCLRDLVQRCQTVGTKEYESLMRKKIQKMINQNYPGMMMFARDADLPRDLINRYKPGMIILERGFVDATARVGGMVTNCRYCILSNHMANFGLLAGNTSWQLHVTGPGARFKVLGVHTCQEKTAIFLLHLPDDDSWKWYQTVEINLDQQLLADCIRRFENKCLQAPIPEVTDREWLERCSFPVGMDENGTFWPVA